MKTAISTVCCMGTPPEQITEILQKYKIDGIEIRLDQNGAVLGAETPAQLETISGLISGSGMQITNLGSSVCLTTYDTELIQASKAALDQCIHIHSPAVRIFLGNFCVKTNDPRVPLDRGGIAPCRKSAPMGKR